MRQTISLNGDGWHCAQSQMTVADSNEIKQLELQAIPATVPGEVRLDLLRAGKLDDDLFYGCNNEKSRWVEACDWWYWRDFDLKLESGQRAWVILYGADYVSWTYLNGALLGEHEGMFSRQMYEITTRAGKHNRLAVRFLAPARLPRHRSTPYYRFLNRLEHRFIDASCEPDRRDTLKCQMTFGWDFSPMLRTIGLWDDVDLIITGEVALFDVQVKCNLAGVSEPRQGSAKLTISFDADALTAGATTLALSLAGQTFACAPITRSFEANLPAGRTRLTFELDVPEPHLWFPWDHGQPDLYTLTVEAQRGERTLDRVTESVGLREIVMKRNPNSPPDAIDWTVTVNGEPVYVRGANWVPADALPGRVSESDYRALLTLAREANLNLLRVWGGGLREKKAFYDLCDRLGLLLWQEFPLACAFVTRYPRSEDYLALVDAEVREIVRQVRNHPSVMLWCGGNEFYPDQNAPVIQAMRRAALAEDDTRTSLGVSPARGDSHNWLIWHKYRPPEAYQQDLAQFISEFGLQAPPNIASLTRFIPPDELWPPGRSWKYHRAQMGKLTHYARPYQIANNLEGFVEASQRAQARGIQIAIEHARRRKYATSGFAVWQFNSPWPGIDWALVDYYRVPKLAYHRLKELANPVLVSLDFELRRCAPGEAWSADVWAINDLPRELSGCRVEIECGHTQVFLVNLKPDSAEMIGQVTWTLPAVQDDWRITCRVMQGGQTLSTNRYDLREYDGRRQWWRL
jgi:beta-mannosidase